MKFQLGQPKPEERAKALGLAGGEKRRLAFLLGGLVVVGGVLISTLHEARKGGAQEAPRPVLDETVVSEPLLAVPELDLARLAPLIQEREEADRVVLESEAVDLVMQAARRYTPRHFMELAAPPLDAGTGARLAADPRAARGKPFVARGRIEDLRPRLGSPHEEQFLGRLRLEDGSTAHFLVLSVPADAASVGGFVRVDGLFYKVFSSEDAAEPGTWHAGPLLVGGQAVRSYPDFGEVTVLDANLLAEVEDANLTPDPGQEPKLVYETSAEPLWHLLAFARDLPADAIEWEQAPELDQELLDRLLESPAEYRGLPVQLPISRLQDGRVCLSGENPARMERTMQGWIGNLTWKNVIQFRTPVLHPEFAIGDLVYGRGFFLHNFAYESAGRGLRVAPVFVLQSFERHIPVPSAVLTRIPWLMAGIGLGLGLLFLYLTKRDKRQAAQFYETIVRRRRERRGAKDSVGTAAP